MDNELALGLYELSEKYMIDELKKDCEDHLAENLTFDVCLEIAEKACFYDFYQAPSVRKKVLRLLEANLESILKRKDFEDLPKLIYVDIKRIQWNQRMIFDPFLLEFMKEEPARIEEEGNFADPRRLTQRGRRPFG